LRQGHSSVFLFNFHVAEYLNNGWKDLQGIRWLCKVSVRHDLSNRQRAEQAAHFHLLVETLNFAG
jgi:hypothetical protein